MGDKNKTLETDCCSAQVKVGHGILKAAYVTTPACCATVTLFDFGAVACAACCGELIATICAGTADFQAPYINTPFNAGLTAIITGAGKVLLVFE